MKSVAFISLTIWAALVEGLDPEGGANSPTILLSRAGSPRLEFNTWGSCSLWFDSNKEKVAVERYFLPDIYDSGITIIGNDGCLKDTNRSRCDNDRGRTFNISDLTTWTEHPNSNAAQSFFAPGSWRSLWWNMSSNATDPTNSISPIYGTENVSPIIYSKVELNNQTTRLIQGPEPFYATIGLAPLDSDFSRRPSYEKSFIGNMKDVLPKMKSLSWSYADALPLSASPEWKYFHPEATYSAPSVVLGGYDDARCNFTSIDGVALFNFSRAERPYDHFRLPNLTIMVNSSDKTGPLNFTFQDVLIDTATPFVWLPEPITTEINEYISMPPVNTSFGPDLYIPRGSTTNTWWPHNTTISFEIPSALTSSKVFMQGSPLEWYKRIHVPYELTRYNAYVVPIKALPPNQTPVIGRSFFTYACMLANYDKGVFAITPQTFRYDGISKIQTTENAFQETKKAKPARKRAYIILGVIVGVVVLSLIAIIVALFVRRKKKQKRKADEEKAKKEEETRTNEVNELDSKESKAHIIEKDGVTLVETDGSELKELIAQKEPVELEGSPLSELSSSVEEGKDHIVAIK